MKLLFDQNISFRVVRQLKLVLPDSIGVEEVGLLNANDYEIWEYARQYAYTVVTFDRDIPMIGSVRGFPPKIIWLRIGNTNKQQLVSFIKDRIAKFTEFIIHRNEGCLQVYHAPEIETENENPET